MHASEQTHWFWESFGGQAKRSGDSEGLSGRVVEASRFAIADRAGPGGGRRGGRREGDGRTRRELRNSRNPPDTYAYISQPPPSPSPPPLAAPATRSTPTNYGGPSRSVGRRRRRSVTAKTGGGHATGISYFEGRRGGRYFRTGKGGIEAVTWRLLS